MPTTQFETGQRLVKRFKAVQEAKEEFWDQWVKEIFPLLLKQKKWYKYKRDAKVRDVFLRKDKTAAGQTYKYARIVAVHTGVDGKVRSADVEYKVDPEDPEIAQENREEEAYMEPGSSGGNMEEGRKEMEPGLENLPQTVPKKNSITPEKEAPSKENEEETLNEGGNSGRQEEKQEETARAQLTPHDNLRVTYHNTAEEMQDMGQALRTRRGRPQKVVADTGRCRQETIFPQLHARGVYQTVK
jgi:hypothetical protein